MMTVDLAVTIKDDFLQVFQVGIVDEGAEVGPVWRGNWGGGEEVEGGGREESQEEGRKK